MSHLLNKPIESICGYLTVLPGAFSAFRWAAVEVRCRSTAARQARIGSMPQQVANSCSAHNKLAATCTRLLQGEPLRRYFYGLYSQNDLSAFEANMYLAEDRVLCLEIVARKNSKY